MTLDLDPIKRREAAASPGPWHPDSDECCVYAEEEASGTGDAIAERVLTPADAAFIAAARQDVPKLIAEVERLRAFIGAMLDHGMTTWSDSSCGGGGVGGQTVATTVHPDVIQHLGLSALHGTTLAAAADQYAAMLPSTTRLDEKAKRARRAGPDGRPV